VHGLDSTDAFGRKPAPAQAFKVHRTRLGRLALGHHERRQVGKQQRVHGRETVRANAAKLVHHRETTQDHPIIDHHMACELRVVGEDRVIAHLAVVRQMHIGHDPVVVAHRGHGPVARRADVEGAKLADRVAVPNHQLTRLIVVLLVLGHSTQGVELKDSIVAADRGVAFDHAVAGHGGSSTDAHMRADHGVRPHAHRRVELSPRADDGRRMDLAHGVQACGIFRMVHISSASAAISSPTLARALNLKMPAFMRSSSTSRIN